MATSGLNLRMTWLRLLTTKQTGSRSKLKRWVAKLWEADLLNPKAIPNFAAYDPGS